MRVLRCTRVDVANYGAARDQHNARLDSAAMVSLCSQRTTKHVECKHGGKYSTAMKIVKYGRKLSGERKGNDEACMRPRHPWVQAQWGLSCIVPK